MRPSTWWAWLIGALVLVVAVVAGLLFLSAGVQATYLVDVVPGADAGLGTSPALEAARLRSLTFGLLLLGLGLAAAGTLIALRRRKPR